MPVKEIMSTEVVVVKSGSKVKAAVDFMVKFKVGCVLVVTGKKATGIITERDVLEKVTALKKDIEILEVDDVMSKPLITISPEASVEEASELMMSHHIKKLPVVEEGRLVGIMTTMDIMANEPEHVKKLAELVLKPTVVVGG